MSPTPDAHASAPRPQSDAALNVSAVRQDFPILQQTIAGKPLVYLDNAATTQKPKTVIEAQSHFLATDNANVHRAVHRLSQRATDLFERSRRRVQDLLNAAQPREIIFVRGTTEAINLVANTFGRAHIGPGDEIVLTTMEHHSNIVPWQMLCQATGAVLRVAPIDDDGDLVMEAYEDLLGPRTRLVSVVHVSNALGTINPVKRITEMAHQVGARVLLDGAQAVSHLPVDVQDLDCDFYAFSGHKMFGPTGIGVLYGKSEILEAMPPWQGGGDMIESVSFEKTTYTVPPHKFEAGTPHIAGGVGLGAAVDYLLDLGLRRVAAYEEGLLDYATAALGEVPGLRIIGTARHKASVISFVMEGVHPHDIGTIVDTEGVAIRTGHHCAQPVMARFGVPATARASLALYNTVEDVDALVRALHLVSEVFA